MYDIWPHPNVGLPSYPLGIKPNVALAEPRTSMHTPQQGLLKGCNGVRLKVYEKWDKGSRPKNKPPRVCKQLHWDVGKLEVFSLFLLNLYLNWFSYLIWYDLCTQDFALSTSIII